jgi:mannose-6-phosphate isomerase
MKLSAHAVEKPWGKSDLPPQFAAQADAKDGGRRKIGEIWFEEASGRRLPLLVKYIFTSERLSVQVHPNDAQARAKGEPNGKTECWYVVAAEPDSTIALGLHAPADAETLRAAALDGSIERLMDWKPVKAGDFFYVPAGTVHAIGTGIALIEVQQQSDMTYRLYDYGRPRELHLEDGVAVAQGVPYPPELMTNVAPGTSRTLVPGPHFRLNYVEAAGAVDALIDAERWVLPLEGEVTAGGETGRAGDCLLVPAGEALAASEGAKLLVAAAGG